MLPLVACMFTFTNIGDVTTPILRVVPFQVYANTSQFYFEFVNLHYVPVAKSIIEQVQISFKIDTGNDVPFCTGKKMITLHFRQRIWKVILITCSFLWTPIEPGLGYKYQEKLHDLTVQQSFHRDQDDYFKKKKKKKKDLTCEYQLKPATNNTCHQIAK